MDKNTKGIVDMFEGWFAKAPALPTGGREAIVKITPILALIFGILGVLGALGSLGIFTVLSPFAMMGGVGSYYGSGMIAGIFWLVSAALMLAAFPGTKARKLSGWNMLFWSQLVNVVGSLVAMSIFSAIISALIGFYLLFQIKSYYK